MDFQVSFTIFAFIFIRNTINLFVIFEFLCVVDLQYKLARTSVFSETLKKEIQEEVSEVSNLLFIIFILDWNSPMYHSCMEELSSTAEFHSKS